MAIKIFQMTLLNITMYNIMGGNCFAIVSVMHELTAGYCFSHENLGGLWL